MAKVKPARRSAFAEGNETAKEIQETIITKISKNEIINIKIDEILSPSFHDRKGYSKLAIIELAENIKALGKLLQPIIVRKTKDGYERIVGFRRIEAYKYNCEIEIPAIVLEEVSKEDAILYMASENLQREDPNVYDQTVSIIEYIAAAMKDSEKSVTSLLYRIKNYNNNNIKNDLTTEEDEARVEIESLLKKTGKLTVNSMIDRLRVLNIDDRLKMAMRERGLSYTNAVILDKLNGKDILDEMIDSVISSSMSKRETKNLVENAQIKSIMIKPISKEEERTKECLSYKKHITSANMKKLEVGQRIKVENLLKEISMILEVE